METISRKIKTLLCVVMLALTCALTLSACGSKVSTDGPTIGVDFSIDASAVGQGEILSTHLTLPEKSSVYDALEASKVPFEGSKKYIKSINGLAEKAYGGTSGWTFTVNGDMVMKGCGKYKLSDGDVVVWRYVTEELDM